MKKELLLLVVFLYSLVGSSQSILDFKQLRYEEDYSRLQTDSSTDWYRQLKYTPLNQHKTSYISVGGDIRLQYFNIQNEVWGDEPKDKDGFLFARYQAHADLHAGKYFRAFVQLQSSLVNGRLKTSGVDENPLEVHQAFVDINTFLGGKATLTLRAGRQEMFYGSQRIISVRDGPNNRLSFDALKGIFHAGDYQFDLFYSQPVAAQKGLFNDKLNKDAKFWGAYLIKNKFLHFTNIDLYYVGLWKRNASFDDGKGREKRHSVGSRLWGNVKSWKYDAEGLYQFGHFADKRIDAWTASLSTSYEFSKTKLRPTIGLKTEMISGDAYYGDNKLETFNPLFPRGGYFGLASIIGPSNLIDVHPSLAITPLRHLTWSMDYDVFWRYSRNDGIYAPHVALIYSGKKTNRRFIGQQLSCDLVYTPNSFMYFRGEFTWFKAGDFLKEVGTGKDILFTGITTWFKL
jgi:hypothetical protein